MDSSPNIETLPAEIFVSRLALAVISNEKSSGLTLSTVAESEGVEGLSTMLSLIHI